MGEPSKDKNGKDDNKRTRTGNVFATTVSPIGRENMGTWPKCATYNSYHALGGPCCTCFNYMSGCSIDQKVKYTAGSFVGKALTCWKSQIHTLSREVAISMSWNDFKFMMIAEFCPSHEMQKLETELWNHAMAGHAAYTDRFHKLARLVPHLVTLESRKIERYVYGFTPQIRGMVVATEPKTMQKAVQISGALTDEAVRNGSIKKVEKKGNVGKPSKDKNGS
nr:reverse transcriptase domain-containing protein [Tanacetum cinerariifolium]